MYYSLCDNQLSKIRHFALNLNSKKDVRLALIDFLLLGNFSEEGEKSIKKNSLNNLCNYYEFELIKSANPIPDDFEL